MSMDKAAMADLAKRLLEKRLAQQPVTADAQSRFQAANERAAEADRKLATARAAARQRMVAPASGVSVPAIEAAPVPDTLLVPAEPDPDAGAAAVGSDAEIGKKERQQAVLENIERLFLAMNESIDQVRTVSSFPQFRSLEPPNISQKALIDIGVRILPKEEKYRIEARREGLKKKWEEARKEARERLNKAKEERDDRGSGKPVSPGADPEREPISPSVEHAKKIEGDAAEIATRKERIEALKAEISAKEGKRVELELVRRKQRDEVERLGKDIRGKSGDEETSAKKKLEAMNAEWIGVRVDLEQLHGAFSAAISDLERLTGDKEYGAAINREIVAKAYGLDPGSVFDDVEPNEQNTSAVDRVENQEAERIATAEQALENARSIYAEKEYVNTSTWRSIVSVLPGMRGRARSDRQEQELAGFRADYDRAKQELQNLQLENIRQSGSSGDTFKKEMAGLLMKSNFGEGEALYDARLRMKHAKEQETFLGKMKQGFERASKWYQRLDWRVKLAVGVALGAGTFGAALAGAAGATATIVFARAALGGVAGFGTFDAASERVYAGRRKGASEEDRDLSVELITQSEKREDQLEQLKGFLERDITQSDAKLLDRKRKEGWRKVGAVLTGLGMAGLTALLGMRSIHAAEAAAQNVQQVAAEAAAKNAQQVAAAAAHHTTTADMVAAQERFAEGLPGSAADQAPGAADATQPVVAPAAESAAQQAPGSVAEAAKHTYEATLTVPKGGSIEGEIIKHLHQVDPNMSDDTIAHLAHKAVLDRAAEMHLSPEEFNRVLPNMDFSVHFDHAADGHPLLSIGGVENAEVGAWGHAVSATDVHSAVEAGGHVSLGAHGSVDMLASHQGGIPSYDPSGPVLDGSWDNGSILGQQATEAHTIAQSSVAEQVARRMENFTDSYFSTLDSVQRADCVRTVDYFMQQIAATSPPGEGFDVMNTAGMNAPSLKDMLSLSADRVLHSGTNVAPEQARHFGEFVTASIKAFPEGGPLGRPLGSVFPGEKVGDYVRRITIHMLKSSHEVKLNGFGVIQTGRL
jgi:hypothetical protein